MISRFAKSFVAIVVALLLLSTVTFFHPPSRAYIDPWSGELFGEGGMEQSLRTSTPHPNPPILGADGGVIMPKLGNATAKAELGRATWKLLHTMTLRYPEKPTQDERDALSSYFHLLSRLYPCGECASEFQMLLKKYPPQVRNFNPLCRLPVLSYRRLPRGFLHQFGLCSRPCISSGFNSAQRLCSVHNVVNER
ncbi:ERV/ALR sulfhydryl oxidase domain-containing protein [Mycena olivaceomarginata]|nr:ERV/ALR sulfhydryl oxidase domain-containing protein [Mycena olivaceomarginata]